MQLLKRLSRLEREWLPEVQRATERLLREQQAPRRDPVPLDYARSWTHPDIRKLYGWHDPWSAAIDRYFRSKSRSTDESASQQSLTSVLGCMTGPSRKQIEMTRVAHQK